MKQAPYDAVLSKSGKVHHVHVCMTTPTHVVCGQETAKRMAPLYKHGKLPSAITLIQRRESTIPAIKLVLNHSAHPHKKYVLN